jgi:hypothetical protein
VKLSKQRKVYAAFLGLAAIAFVADRVLFLPAGAGAAPLPEKLLPAETTVSSESPPKAAAPKAEQQPVGPTLATKLSDTGAIGATERDPFRRPWIQVRKVTTTKGSSSPVTASDFAAKYELKAVSRVGDNSVAVIGKTSCKVGSQVEEWTLVAIDDRSATLERGAERVILKLRGTEGVDNSIKPSGR